MCRGYLEEVLHTLRIIAVAFSANSFHFLNLTSLTCSLWEILKDFVNKDAHHKFNFHAFTLAKLLKFSLSRTI